MAVAKDYLEAKGGRASRAADSPSATRSQLPVLNKEQLDHLNQMRADHRQYLPEFEPFIKELYELGMVDGWRCLKTVVVFEREGNEKSKEDSDYV